MALQVPMYDYKMYFHETQCLTEIEYVEKFLKLQEDNRGRKINLFQITCLIQLYDNRDCVVYECKI